MVKRKNYTKAEKRVRAKKKAVKNGITWFAFIFFFIFIDMTDGDPGIQWAFFPIFGWGLGVFFQFMKAFDYFGYGEKWEKEELEKELSKGEEGNEEDKLDLETRDKEEVLDLDRIKEPRHYKDSDFV